MQAHEIKMIDLLEVYAKAKNTLVVYISYNGVDYDMNQYKDETFNISQIAKNIPDITINETPLARHLYFLNKAYYTFDTAEEAYSIFSKIKCEDENYGVFAAIISPITGLLETNS